MKKLSLLAMTALLGACQSMQPAAKTSLDGEVFYLQRIVSAFIHTIEKRQGMKVACLEEIAFRNKWLSAEGVAMQAEKLKKTEYGAYLKRLLSGY